MISFKGMLKSLGFRKEEIKGSSKFKHNPILDEMLKPKGRTLIEAEKEVWSRKKIGDLKGLTSYILVKKPIDMETFYDELCGFKSGNSKYSQDYFNRKYGFDRTCRTRFVISLIIKRYAEFGFDFRSPNMLYCEARKIKK